MNIFKPSKNYEQGVIDEFEQNNFDENTEIKSPHSMFDNSIKDFNYILESEDAISDNISTSNLTYAMSSTSNEYKKLRNQNALVQ